MRTQRIASLLLVVSFVAWSTPVWAQTATSGTIAGAVRDISGAVLPGVTVEAASPALIEKVRTVVTDGQGRYSIVELRPGIYTVTFTLPGFSTVRREGLELTAGFTATVNADLQVGALEETLTVTGATPVVDVQSTRTQSVLSRQVLDAIPAAKTFNTYVALIPGVTNTSTLSRRDVGGNGGEPPFGLAVHGSDQGMTTIDGFMTMAVETPSIHKMNPNAIAMQETVIETGNGSAEAWSGGVNIHIISKAGGNTFNGTVALDYSGQGLDTNNLTDELRARGLNRYNEQKRLYDVGVGFGGPILRDRLWFYATPRRWVTENYVAGMYYNKLQHTLFYEPDLSRQATFGRESWDTSGRLTWQAATAHKFTFQVNNGSQCFCPIGPDGGTTTPDGGRHYIYGPQRLVSGAWTHPATSRLLLEVGGAWRQDDNTSRRTPGVEPTDRSILDEGLNLTYGSDYFARVDPNWQGAYGTHPGRQLITRGSLSYVTGSHAFKTGWTTLRAKQILKGALNFDDQYVFRNQVPIAINQSANPNHLETRVALFGLYAQDQWTVKRLTLNLGARFESIRGSSPEQVRPGGTYLPDISFEAKNNIPDWTNIHPRLGAAYDLFGNGKTALKVSLGRYELSNNFGLVLPRTASPVGELVLRTRRTWNDVNGDYSPDCDLQSKVANRECGAMENQNFGSRVVSTRYADAVLEGWGASPNLWTGQVSWQQQLAPNVGLTVGYFRTWYGNIYATDNLAVTPSDFAPFCVAAPVDTRLPGDGGNQLCDGLFDVAPEKFGRRDDLVTLAPERSKVFNGVDVLLSARFAGGYLLSGGLSTGQLVTDNCASPDVPVQFCREVRPWRSQTDVKFNGVAPLPWWGLQVSATYQNLPGIAQGATHVVSNSQIAPSLGRNLAACPQTTGPCNATVIATVVEPFTMFEVRENQLDARISKIFRFGRIRLQGNFDIYNLFNIASVLSVQSRYGASWLNAQSILAGRFIKFSTQLDF